MEGILLYPVHTGQADPPLGNIDDPAHSQIISGIVYGFQIGQKILDLLSGVEVDAPYQFVGNIG